MPISEITSEWTIKLMRFIAKMIANTRQTHEFYVEFFFAEINFLIPLYVWLFDYISGWTFFHFGFSKFDMRNLYPFMDCRRIRLEEERRKKKNQIHRRHFVQHLSTHIHRAYALIRNVNDVFWWSGFVCSIVRVFRKQKFYLWGSLDHDFCHFTIIIIWLTFIKESRSYEMKRIYIHIQSYIGDLKEEMRSKMACLFGLSGPMRRDEKRKREQNKHL